jgi:hypothetical protein
MRLFETTSKSILLVEYLLQVSIFFSLFKTKPWHFFFTDWNALKILLPSASLKKIPTGEVKHTNDGMQHIALSLKDYVSTFPIGILSDI